MNQTLSKETQVVHFVVVYRKYPKNLDQTVLF